MDVLGAVCPQSQHGTTRVSQGLYDRRVRPGCLHVETRCFPQLSTHGAWAQSLLVGGHRPTWVPAAASSPIQFASHTSARSCFPKQDTQPFTRRFWVDGVLPPCRALVAFLISCGSLCHTPNWAASHAPSRQAPGPRTSPLEHLCVCFQGPGLPDPPASFSPCTLGLHGVEAFANLDPALRDRLVMFYTLRECLCPTRMEASTHGESR